MKRILSLMLILIVGAFLFASDNNDDTKLSGKLFVQLEQDTLTVTGEDVEPEITKEQDQDTLITDEKEKEEEKEWEEDEEWDEEEEHGMTLWDFLSRLPDSYKQEFLESKDIYKDDKLKGKRKRGYFRGGAGGFDVYMLPLNIDVVKTKLTGIELDPFDDQMFLTCGGGWGYVGKNIRLGGVGFGGSVVSDGQTGEIAKEVTLRLGMGGLIIEKTFHPFNSSEIYIGTMVGGGTATLDLVQWSGPVKWDELWGGYTADSVATPNSFYDYQSELESNFFVLIPTIGIRYNIFRWCAIGANVGYVYSHMDQRGWKMEGKRITGDPEIDFSNIIYRFNVYFGG